MNVFAEITDLPKRIQENLPQEIISNFIAGFKTALKPNVTIPILWMIIYKNGIVLCCTHKTRCVFKQIIASDIDSIKVHKGLHFSGAVLQILFKEISEEDFFVMLPSGINCGEIKDLLRNQGYQILES